MATVHLSRSARDSMEADAQSAMPNETGGILTGWREGTEVIHVSASFVISDPNASGHAFQRDFGRATEVLRAALDEEGRNSPIGYVGEWHSHPAHCGASRADKRSMRHIARTASGPVVLVVISRSTTGWVVFAETFSRFRFIPATIQQE